MLLLHGHYTNAIWMCAVILSTTPQCCTVMSACFVPTWSILSSVTNFYDLHMWHSVCPFWRRKSINLMGWSPSQLTAKSPCMHISALCGPLCPNNPSSWMRRSHFLPADDELVSYGTVAPVAGTAFDFTTPTTIGSRIDEARADYPSQAGYDLHYLLWGFTGPQALAATHNCRVYDE